MENELNILMRFLVDKQSQAMAKKAVDEVQGVSGGGVMGALNKQFATLESAAKKLPAAQQKIFSSTLQNVKQVTAEYITQEQAAGRGVEAQRNIADLTGEIEAGMKGVNTQAEKTVKYTSGIRSMFLGALGLGLTRVGSRLSQLGTMGLSPMMQYVKQYGESEAASAAWLANQNKIENSMMRIGRVMSTQLIGWFEQLAKITEKVADYMEKNEDAAGNIAKALAGGMVGGKVLGVLGDVIVAVASLKAISALTAKGAGVAVAGSGISLSAVLAYIPPIAAAVVTFMGMKYLGKMAEDYGRQHSLGYFKTLSQGQLEQVSGSNNPALNAAYYAANQDKLNGAIVKVGKSADNTANSLNKLGPSVDQMGAYLDYYRQEQEATQDYLQSRNKLIEDFNRDAKNNEANYLRNREQVMRDFWQNERQLWLDYMRQRTQLAADYNIEVIRAEEDSQREMLKLREDHDVRMADLVANRDALGMVREMRAFDRKTREAEEDYQVEARRRSEDFARRMAEMAAEFIAQRKQRIAQFQQRLKDMAEEHKLERKRAREEFNQKLVELQNNYISERKKRREAMVQMLADTIDFGKKEVDYRRQFNSIMLTDLQNMINNARQITGGVPGRQHGGYTSDGLYKMHNNEYVLNAQTTRSLENMARGRLTQSSILSMVLGGGKSNVNINARYDGRITARDRRDIEGFTRQIIGEAFA